MNESNAAKSVRNKLEKQGNKGQKDPQTKIYFGQKLYNDPQ